MARLSATMALLSAVFWFTSWPPIPISRDFPNCIAAGLDGLFYEVSFVSNNRVSTLVATRQDTLHKTFWSENQDGYCCMWNPPATPEEQKGGGFSVILSPNTIGWDCPYWLMTLLWIVVGVRYFRAWQIRVGDLLYFMTLIALVVTLIQVRFALPLVVLMNLATVGLCLTLIIGAVRWFSSAPNPMWPLTLPAESGETNTSPVGKPH